MEGSSRDRWSRRRRHADLLADEAEEGEFVAGHRTGEETEEYDNHRGCSSDSGEAMVSDSVPANYGDASPCPSFAAANNNHVALSPPPAVEDKDVNASSSPAPSAVLASPLCGKEFSSHKAMCRHMKVHREEEGVQKDRDLKRKRDVAGVGSRWGATNIRGCSGSRARAASPSAESDQSMAVVAAESKIVLQPKPLAFALPNLSPVPMASAAPKKQQSVPVASSMANDSIENSSQKPMANDAMERVVVRAAHQATEAVVHLHAAPPPAAPVHLQLFAPPPGHRPSSPTGHTCKTCYMWFPTCRGLGGHTLGHKNRGQLAAAVQDGGAAAPYGCNANPKKTHVCKICAAEFPGGVQLGGHMRKHWAGPPINKRPRFVIEALPPPRTTTEGVADLPPALPAKADEALPAPRPAVAGRVLLFGVDIGPAAQEGSSATEADSSASTSGKQ